MRRMIAIIIDMYILGILANMVMYVVNPILFNSTIKTIMIILVLIMYVYLLLHKDSLIGYESIGKKIMRIGIYKDDERVMDKEVLYKRNKTTLILGIFSIPKIVLMGKSDGDLKYNTEVKRITNK